MNHDHLRHPRIHGFDTQLASHGQHFVTLMEGLHRADAPADAAIAAVSDMPVGQAMALFNKVLASKVLATGTREAPAAMTDLVAEASQVPQWVDWQRVERGAATMMRTGILGGITLGAKSLVEGYCAPAGNKPLAMSGRLRDQAAMRLTETARFVEAVAAPRGMRPGNEGFAITLKVRLMHARVRALIMASGRWRDDLWATPINQHDMVATIHLFSTAFMDGVEFLGMKLSPEDREDFLHLWRYVGHVIGVEDHLLPRTMAEARTQWSMINTTQGPPDEDSRALTLALLEGPVRDATTPQARERALKHAKFAKGICRALIGAERADALGLPKARWTRLAPLFRGALKTLNRTRKVPFVDPWLEERGRAYWGQTIALGSQGQPVRFSLPAELSPLG